MDVLVAQLGMQVAIVAPGVIELADGRVLALSARGEVAPTERPAPAAVDRGPFEHGLFGAAVRLAWTGGGMAVPAGAGVVFWSARWAAVIEPGALTVVDGVANRVARIERHGLAVRGVPAAGHGKVWIAGEDAAYVLDCGQLEGAVGMTRMPIAVETVYPLREPQAAVAAKVVWMLAPDDALVNIGTQQIHVLGAHGLAKGMQLVARDAYLPRVYGWLEKPNGERVPRFTPEPPRAREAPVVRARPRDPAAHTAAIDADDPRITRLLVELAREPDNAATRTVLVDLLQELGAELGAWIAEGRAPDRHALGPLAHYLADVAFREGLPWSATVARTPPLEDRLLALAASDVRLGMLSALRIGEGPLPVYVRLVGSRRALGLRHVDVPDRAVAEALAGAACAEVTHLHGVRLADRKLVALLAGEPFFDSVRELSTQLRLRDLEAFLKRIERDAGKFFARAPRTLVVTEQFRHDRELVEPMLRRFPTLPLAGLVVGGVTVRRVGDALAVVAPGDAEVLVRRALPQASLALQ